MCGVCGVESHGLMDLSRMDRWAGRLMDLMDSMDP
jgi:hypothetical protein